MSTYKIINNKLSSQYGVDSINATYYFKKIKFSDLFKEIEVKEIELKKDKIKNEIVINTILKEQSIDDILSSFPDDTYNKNIKDEVAYEIKPIVKKTQEQQKINHDENINPEDKSQIMAKKIEEGTISEKDKNYYNKIKKTLRFEDNDNICNHLNILIKYNNVNNLTWYDVGVMVWSINSIFSSYFQDLFIEISKMNNHIYEDDLESDAGYVLNKILKNQTLEIYEMFKFVNRAQENSRTEFVTKLEKQENKDKYNLLKCFLDSESVLGVEKSHFYKITLNNFRKFRNFHAHHNDERTIEKLIIKKSPENFKIKFYNKFLGNLDEEGKGLLQFIMERA